jgi:hypothetical protein
MRGAIMPTFFLFFILLVLSFSASADLSGAVKYSFENNFTGREHTAQYFSQEYLTNFRGVLFDNRIGDYQLGLQYQRGTTELKNISFSNSLNFRDALRLTSSFFRRDYYTFLDESDRVVDNRYSISAVYFTPNLPALTVGYETGLIRSASFEGTSKYDKKGEIGLSYSFLNNNISARFVRSVFSDDTYLATANNVINRNDLFSLNGSSRLGERLQLNGSYFNQRLYNQIGATSMYYQNQQRIIIQGNLKIAPYLSFNPQYLSSNDLTEYIAPASQESYQNLKRLDMELNFHPFDQMEFVANRGSGQVEYGDALVTGIKQHLVARKVGMNLKLFDDYLVNTSLRDETYLRVGSSGKVTIFNGFISIPLWKGLKLTYRKSLSSSVGVLYPPVTSGSGKQSLDDCRVTMSLPYALQLEGAYSQSFFNSYKYRNASAEIKFSPGAGVFEYKHEFQYGDEVTQHVQTNTDSLKASFSFGGFEVAEQFYLISSKTVTDSAVSTLPGLRNNSEIKYTLGETVFDLTVNSEKRDSNASLYTRTYLSVIRNF